MDDPKTSPETTPSYLGQTQKDERILKNSDIQELAYEHSIKTEYLDVISKLVAAGGAR
jgi:hypothetical protein